MSETIFGLHEASIVCLLYILIDAGDLSRSDDFVFYSILDVVTLYQTYCIYSYLLL